MEQPKPSTSRLFITSVIENKRDEIEEKLEQGHQTLLGLTTGLSEQEAHDALNNAVSRDKAHEEAVCLGLLCVILSDPPNAAKSFRDMGMVLREGFSIVLGHLNHLVMEKWLRMTDIARSQLLWMMRELIRAGVTGIDNVCYNLMRQAAGGDISPRNIVLIDYMLDIFMENRAWLEKHPILLTSVVYNYLRLIEDHSAPQFTNLRNKETTFLITLLRERWGELMTIGRDLVRLLQNVARIPEFQQLWRDLHFNPKSLCPTFTGVHQLLQTRTSRRFFQGRLTPEQERKMVFLTSHVRFGHHKRYQDWFLKQYLATPESHSLRVDLTRFIVAVIHPTNELLCSDIIPRWAIIGWLLTTCTSLTASANIKLALFYDWLFYDIERDNIMNIEPGILVMYHSIRSHPAVTASLLDFLCRIIPNYWPSLTDKVKAGIFASLRHIIDKRVLPSLHALFDHTRMDKDLQTMVRDTFHEFCFPQPVPGVKTEEAGVKEENHRDMMCNSESEPADAVFSDEEMEARQGEQEDDDIPLAKVKLKGSPVPDVTWNDDEEEGELGKGLDGALKESVERLHQETDNEARCEGMERLVQLVIQDDEADSDTLTALGHSLCTVLRDSWTSRVFPADPSNAAIEDSIGRPLFVLFRNLSELSEDDSRRLPLLTVLSEMYSIQPRIGYLLLYYLQASTLNDDHTSNKNSSNGKSQVYKELCETQDKELEAGLLTDLKLCQEEDSELLCWLVPLVYSQFSQVSVGNASLLHLVVSTIDAKQLQDLICRVLQGKLVMFRADLFQSLLTASLSWETFEQLCLWQLVAAHDIPVDYILPILPRLEFSTHSEALTAILLTLKQERPTAELLRQVVSRDVRPGGDMFVLAALRSWCREHEEKLAELLASLLGSCCPPPSPNKRKRGKANNTPSADKLLGHLDHLRSSCKSLYKLDCMQKALHQAQAHCSDSQKATFSNLFALVEVEDSTKSKGRGRKVNHSVKSKPKTYKNSDTSEESSEEEEVVRKLKQAKKRKKQNPVNSDSD